MTKLWCNHAFKYFSEIFQSLWLMKFLWNVMCQLANWHLPVHQLAFASCNWQHKSTDKKFSIRGNNFVGQGMMLWIVIKNPGYLKFETFFPRIVSKFSSRIWSQIPLLRYSHIHPKDYCVFFVQNILAVLDLMKKGFSVEIRHWLRLFCSVVFLLGTAVARSFDCSATITLRFLH